MTSLEAASCGDDCYARFEPTVTSAQPLPLAWLVEAAAIACGVTTEDILSSRKHRRTVLARSVYVVLARLMTTHSFPEIALAMCRRSHSTLVSANRRGRGCLADGDLPFEAALTDAAHWAIGRTGSPAQYTAIWDRRLKELKREVADG